jgi:aarF domain-containing kinase
MRLSRENMLALFLVPLASTAFRMLSPTNTSPHIISSAMYAKASDTTALMRDMQARILANDGDSDSDAALMLSALRGQNLNDDDRAKVGTTLQLVDFDAQAEAELPYDYQPQVLKEFFRKRPAAVLQRVIQILSVGGGFAFRVLLDQVTGRFDEPEREIARAVELRDLLTSLGPFFIK